MQRMMWEKITWAIRWEMCTGMTWPGYLQGSYSIPPLLKYAARRMSFQWLLQLLCWVLLKYPVSTGDPYQRENRACLHAAKHLSQNWNHYSASIFRHWDSCHYKGKPFRVFQFPFWYLSLCSYSQWLDKCMFFLPKKKVKTLYIW